MKKFLALVLALCCTLTVAAMPSLAEEEPTVIKFMTFEHVHSLMNNDIMTFKTMEEALNITIEWQIVPSETYNEKVNLVLTSGDFPDVMEAPSDLISPYYDADIVYCLDDLIPEYVPNFLTACNDCYPDYVRNITSDDGHIWYFTKIEYSNYNCFPYLNGDWLEELNLAVPTTMEELYDVLAAFKAAKGDDCIPWITGPWADLTYAVNYFGTGIGGESWIHAAEGEYDFGPYDRADQLKEALTFLNKCYDAGLIDPDFLTRDDDSKNALISQNKVGFFITWGDNGAIWSKGGADGLNFIIPAPFSGAGEKPHISSTNAIFNPYYIMKTKDSEAKLPKILEMFNYIYSEEGQTLFSWGIEGETFTVNENGEKQFTDAILNHELSGVNGRRQMGINPNPFPHVSLGTAWDALMHPESVAGLARHAAFRDLPLPVLSPTPDEATESASLYADIKKYVKECFSKFVIGEMSVDTDWETYLQTLRDLGVERYEEIIKGEYQRWLAR